MALISNNHLRGLNTVVASRLDRELAARTFSSSLSTFLLLGSLFLIPNVIAITGWVPRFGAVLIFLGCLQQLWVARFTVHMQQTLPKRYKIGLMSGALVSAVGWALIMSGIYARLGFEDPRTFLAVSLLSAFSWVNLSALGASRKLFLAFAAITLLGPIAATAFTEQPIPVFVPPLFLVYFMFLSAQSRLHLKNLTDTFTNNVSAERNLLLLQTCLDASPGFIACVDENLQYVAMNKHLKEFLDVGSQGFLNKTLGSFGLDDIWTKPLKESMATGRTQVTEQVKIEVWGTSRWHLLSINKSVETGLIVFISIDINDEKQMELKAQQQRVLAETSAKMAALGEMAGGIAHEINNPLQIISGKSGLLVRRLKTEAIDSTKYEADLVRIEEMVQRIAKIIRGLRSFSRNAENDPFVPASLTDIVQDTLSLCSARLANHGIEIQVNVVPATYVSCRATQISQVLLNLLNNAHDAVEALPEKWIRLSTEVKGPLIRILVEDSGHGIPENVVKKMMQPFFSTKEVGRGTGMGLSISKGIVEEHGGKLEYDPSGTNTRFVIELPKAEAPVQTTSKTAA